MRMLSCTFFNLRTGGRGGYTLVEIMIVVAVIALLAVMAVPGYRLIRVETRKVRCQNGQRLIRDAVDQWAMANNVVEGEATDADAITGYIQGGTIPMCPDGNLAIAIPGTLGAPVDCPAGNGLHVIPQ